MSETRAWALDSGTPRVLGGGRALERRWVDCFWVELEGWRVELEGFRVTFGCWRVELEGFRVTLECWRVEGGGFFRSAWMSEGRD